MTDSHVDTQLDGAGAGNGLAVADPGAGAAAAGADAQADAGLAQLYRTYYRQDAVPAGAGTSWVVPAPAAAGSSPDSRRRRAVDVLQRHRSLAARRRPGTPVLQVWADESADQRVPAGTASVLQIVADDTPYLVESVTALLGSIGVSVDQIVHPVLIVRRDADGNLVEVLTDRTTFDMPAGATAESWMHLQLSGTPAGLLDQLRARIEQALGDITQIGSDTDAMHAAMDAIADQLERGEQVGASTQAQREEAAALLRWLSHGNFRTLGYRRYEVAPNASDSGDLGIVADSGLGLFRSPEMTDRRFRLNTDGEGEAQRLLVFTQGQAPAMSLRAVFPFLVCVRTFDAQGALSGEHRFLGIFTVTGLHENIMDIPVLASRVHAVLRKAGHSIDSFSGQSMLEIIQTYPRTELFTVDVDTLYNTVAEVASIGLSRELRLFLRADPNGKFVSALVYLPRDRYRTGVRVEMQAILTRELGAASIDYTARVTESVLAQVHFTVRIPDGWQDGSAPDVSEAARQRLQQLLSEATRSWEDRLADEVAKLEPTAAAAQLNRYAGTFPPSYKADFEPTTALRDLARIDKLSGDNIDIALYRKSDAAPGRWQFSLYIAGPGISLSHVLPVLQSMGVEVLDERPYHLVRRDGQQCWIYDFGLAVDPELMRTSVTGDLDAQVPTLAAGAPVAAEQASDVVRRFTDAFTAAWHGLCEVDRFNELVLRAGVDWRQAAMLRGYARYLRQAGFPYSQTRISGVLLEHAATARVLAELFEATFDPVNHSRLRAEDCAATVGEHLNEVVSLDADRVLRAYLRLIKATLRTNYFVGSRPGVDANPARSKYREVLSFKFDPREVPEIPKPRPRFEIFVYSPRIEGVHLRFGMVARGGLRWSDRHEDFRTEILGLVKAQAVKNAVIVPVGSKGGFVVKRPPAPTGDAAADRDAQRAEGVACYRLFISGLLDVTDNLDQSTGAVLSPPDVVRQDPDDSYLVVAADKGTATFSDIANDISRRYGFWLDDAFASGGSAGYDHKAMGITAKGAWESVKRHFREMGVDTQSQDFTVVGVGDMSGDVFGNGMLLSEHIRLVAAFDHRHIFVDPNPDSASSFVERQRMFNLPRSSWDDYDRSLISPGGGVWAKSVKSIPVSAQMRDALGLGEEVTELSPPELVRAILLAPVDLLWNGGIGTYVKSSFESHGEVGDKANDAVRVNGNQLRVKVVGEGGNLGLTQLGRIEFAQSGGRVNSDAMDNSAGVDCSDHEVNIKILLAKLISSGTLPEAERNALLASMTDEVGELVLADNRSQNELMGTSRANAAALLTVHARQMSDLVTRRGLDREIENLPDDQEVKRRRAAGEGLTSPEIATLLAHVKLALKDDLLASDLPDNEIFASRLPGYFPKALQDRFGAAIRQHPLRRQIVTTMLTNQCIDNGGITYAFRLTEDVGATSTDALRAYAAVTRIFDLDNLWRQIRTANVSTQVSDELMLVSRRLLDRAARWLLTNRPQPLAVGAEISRFTREVQELSPQVPGWLFGSDAQILEERVHQIMRQGAPRDLAIRTHSLLNSYCLLDIIEVADVADRDGAEVAELYYRLTAHLGVSRMLGAVSQLERGDRWHALARLALRDDLYGSMRSLCMDVLFASEPDETAAEKITEWELTNASRLDRARTALTEIGATGTYDLATLSVAARQVRSMVMGMGARTEMGR